MRYVGLCIHKFLLFGYSFEPSFNKCKKKKTRQTVFLRRPEKTEAKRTNLNKICARYTNLKRGLKHESEYRRSCIKRPSSVLALRVNNGDMKCRSNF